MQSLQGGPSWSIPSELLTPPETSRVNLCQYCQPLCTAVQVALTDLLASWGVKPAAVVGHSSGEIAAAYAAGHITQKDAIIAAYYRGYGAGRMRSGAMLAVGLGPGEARERIGGMREFIEGRVGVACHNSVKSVTLSGEVDAVERVTEELVSQGVFAKLLDTGGRAYHSHITKEGGLGDIYENQLRKYPSMLKKQRGDVVMVSSVTGKAVDGKVSFDSGYWRKNMESPVLFLEALTEVLSMPSMKNNTVLEIGPHSALAGPIKHIRQSLHPNTRLSPYFPSLVRNKDDVESMLKLAGNLFVSGYPVDLEQVNLTALEHITPLANNSELANGTTFKTPTTTLTPRRNRIVHNMPNYHWNYTKHFWKESRSSSEIRHRKYPRHDLLGARVAGGSAIDALWRNVFRLMDVPWIKDHVVSFAQAPSLGPSWNNMLIS